MKTKKKKISAVQDTYWPAAKTNREIFITSTFQLASTNPIITR